MKCRSVKPLFFFIGSPTYRHIMAGHNEHHHVLEIQDACGFFLPQWNVTPSIVL